MQSRKIFGRHYALAVVAIIFVALLAAAGLRSTPGVLMVPWGQAFGWSRATISFAAACGIFLFGLTGPFAAAAMQRFGIRATMMVALAMIRFIRNARDIDSDEPKPGAGSKLDLALASLLILLGLSMFLYLSHAVVPTI